MIIAELVMSAVDKRMIELSGSKPPTYVRHVDDYWIGGHTHRQCHHGSIRVLFDDLASEIGEACGPSLAGLQIDDQVLWGLWPSGAGGFSVSLGSITSIKRAIAENITPHGDNDAEAVATLGMIVERAVESNDDGIIRNAIRVIDRRRLWLSNWRLLEHFLAQCAVQFPHSFDYVARVVAWRIRGGTDIAKNLWVNIARTTATRDGSLGRDSEVCWAIWLLKELKSRLPKSLTDIVAENASPLVLAFLVHFSKHGMVGDRKLIEKLRSRVEGDPFAGPFWPLTLELTHFNEEDPNWAPANTPPVLRGLHTDRISIIEWNAPPRVFEEYGEEAEPGFPDYAIEEIGSDYPGDDERDNGDEDIWSLGLSETANADFVFLRFQTTVPASRHPWLMISAGNR